MKSHRLFPLLLLFVFAFPGQVQPQARVGSLLQAVSDALDHYEQLAPAIQFEDATEKTLGDSCKSVEMLGRDVHDAKEKIAHYHQLPDPRLTDYSTSIRFAFPLEVVEMVPDTVSDNPKVSAL